MAKNLPHLGRHSQKKQKQKKFFHWRLDDLPSRMRVWTAL